MALNTVNKGVLEALFKAGAFDSIHKNRAQLFISAERLVDISRKIQEDKLAGQGNLFSSMNSNEDEILIDMVYFSNGTEGDILDSQCSECKLWNESCPIIIVQLEYNYGQVGNELARKIMNELVNEKGMCMLKPMLDNL